MAKKSGKQSYTTQLIADWLVGLHFFDQNGVKILEALVCIIGYPKESP
jgi:hypothetical protein